MATPVSVRVSHRYAAPAERVFDAWTTPAQAARFLFATRTGNIMRCEMDARVGGEFMVTDRRPQADGDESVFDAIHRGVFRELSRPTRIVFDFCVLPFSEDTTRVAIDIRPLAAHECELTLTHELGWGEEAEAHAEQARKGWANMLASLERELFPRRFML